jgi:peroxiredoxin Q/BCP
MAKPSPIQAGSKAPKFNFVDGGKELTIGELDGPALVYFYPKDDTPGCTKQACGVRDLWVRFQRAGLQVVGVSKDGKDSHEKFKKKYSLPFPLVSDEDLEIARAYGVFGEKQFMGKTYDAVHRMSFLVAADGTILKTYHKVKPTEHAETVLEDLAAAQ